VRQRLEPDELKPGHKYTLGIGKDTFTYLKPIDKDMGLFRSNGDGSFEKGQKHTFGRYNWMEVDSPKVNSHALSYLDKEW
jgi:hypothetical protein